MQPSMMPQYGQGQNYNQSMGGNYQMPPSQEPNYPHPRQPTEAVYFDPTQQARAPPPARERRRLEIVPPKQ